MIRYNIHIVLCSALLLLLGNKLISQKVDSLSYEEFDQLLNEKIDGSVKYEKTIKYSTNSIQIITADEIQRLGFTNFNEILQYVTDLYSSNDGIWNYVGTRGLLFPSSYGTRIPVILNGHLLADYTFGSVLNTNVLGISLDFIERIEILLGSPSSLYAPNAILGSINIVTKEGKDLDGMNVSVTGSMNGEMILDLLYGYEFSSGLDVIASYKLAYYEGNDIYFEEYDDTKKYGDTASPFYNPRARHKGIAHNKNNYFNNVIYLKASYDNLYIDLIQTISNRGYASAGFETIFDDPSANLYTTYTDFFIKYDYTTNWFGTHTITPKLFYQASKSEQKYNYFYGEGEEIVTENQIEIPIYKGIGIEIVDKWNITSNSNINVGLNYNNSIDYDVAFLYKYNNAKNYDTINGHLKPLQQFLLFGEYLNELNEIFSAFVGMRYFKSFDYNKSILLPRGGLIAHLNDNSTLKAIVGTASRTSSGYEEYTNVYFVNDSLGNEQLIKANDLNYEHSLSSELIYLFKNDFLSVNVSAFLNDMKYIIFEDTLRVKKHDESYPYYYRNMDKNSHLYNYGFSLCTKFETDFGMSISLGNVYSVNDLKLAGYDIDNKWLQEAIISNSPQNTLYYNISYEIIKNLHFNIMGQYETRRQGKWDDEINDMIKLSPVNRINASVTFAPAYTGKNFWNKFYFALNLRNILNSNDYYPVSTSLGTISLYPYDNGFNTSLTIGYKIFG